MGKLLLFVSTTASHSKSFLSSSIVPVAIPTRIRTVVAPGGQPILGQKLKQYGYGTLHATEISLHFAA